MYSSLVLALNHSNLVFPVDIVLNCFLNRILGFLDFFYLLCIDTVLELFRLHIFDEFRFNLLEYPLFIVDLQLVFELISPEVVISQEPQTSLNRI